MKDYNTVIIVLYCTARWYEYKFLGAEDLKKSVPLTITTGHSLSRVWWKVREFEVLSDDGFPLQLFANGNCARVIMI
jgi:hypothetical protein